MTSGASIPRDGQVVFSQGVNMHNIAVAEDDSAPEFSAKDKPYLKMLTDGLRLRDAGQKRQAADLLLRVRPSHHSFSTGRAPCPSLRRADAHPYETAYAQPRACRLTEAGARFGGAATSS